MFYKSEQITGSYSPRHRQIGSPKHRRVGSPRHRRIGSPRNKSLQRRAAPAVEMTSIPPSTHPSSNESAVVVHTNPMRRQAQLTNKPRIILNAPNPADLTIWRLNPLHRPKTTRPRFFCSPAAPCYRTRRTRVATYLACFLLAGAASCLLAYLLADTELNEFGKLTGHLIANGNNSFNVSITCDASDLVRADVIKADAVLLNGVSATFQYLSKALFFNCQDTLTLVGEAVEALITMEDKLQLRVAS